MSSAQLLHLCREPFDRCFVGEAQLRCRVGEAEYVAGAVGPQCDRAWRVRRHGRHAAADDRACLPAAGTSLIEGRPSWMNSDRFDVRATFTGNPGSCSAFGFVVHVRCSGFLVPHRGTTRRLPRNEEPRTLNCEHEPERSTRTWNPEPGTRNARFTVRRGWS